MQVGEVRVAEDTDYAHFKALCTCHDDWNTVYNKNATSVWTRQNDLSDFKMIKVRSSFEHCWTSRFTQMIS